MHQRLHWLPPLLVSVAAVAFLLGDLLLDPSQALLFRDTGTLTLPAKMLIAESLREFGELPLWNPFAVGGVPFLADPSFAVHYPLNLIFLLFPKGSEGFALSWFLALHFPLALFGFYRYFSFAGLTRALALLLSLPVTVGGFAVSSVYMSGALAGIVATGWLLYFWARYLRGGGAMFLFGASAALAWPILAGDPQFTYLLAVFFLPASALSEKAGWRQALTGLAALGALTFLFAGPQLLPSLDLISRSVRADFSFALSAEMWSLHPVRWLELLSPFPLGSSMYQDGRIGEFSNGPDPMPFILSIYPGFLFLPLVVAAARRSRSPGAWAYLAVAGLFFFLSMGAYSFLPLNRAFQALLPLWRSFRYPERLVFFFELALLLWAAPGLARLSPQELLRRLGPVLLALALALLLMAAFSLPFAEGRIPALITGLLLLFAGGLCLARKRLALAPSLICSLLVVASATELALEMRQIVWKVPAKLLDPAWPPFVRLMHEEKAKPGILEATRYYTDGEGRLNWALLERMSKGKMERASLLTLHQFLTLSNNTPNIYGFATSLGYSTLMNPIHEQMWKYLVANRAEAAHPVRGTQFLGRVRESGDFELVKVPGSIPLFSVPAEVTYLPTATGIEALGSPKWNWEKTLLLKEGDADAPTAQPAAAKVKLLSRSFSSLTLAVEPSASSRPFWLHWNESFDPFWEATLDGRPLRLRPANFWSTAVLIEAGGGLVHLRYENPLVPLGRGLFAIWLLLCLGFVIRQRREAGVTSRA